jgi:hypothetical protein
LRVIRKGRLVKDTVDEAIDRCGEVENLRDSIEDARVRAEESSNDWEKKEIAQNGKCIGRPGGTLKSNILHNRSSKLAEIFPANPLPGISPID